MQGLQGLCDAWRSRVCRLRVPRVWFVGCCAYGAFRGLKAFTVYRVWCFRCARHGVESGA